MIPAPEFLLGFDEQFIQLGIDALLFNQSQVANVPEQEILDRLLDECRTFQDRVRRGEARLGDKKVEIIPPDPIGELGSGVEKIAARQVEQITVEKKPLATSH